MAAIVLWGSGQFDTKSISDVLGCREDAVQRTLHFARDSAAKDRRAKA